ncbi:MAG TPA: arginine--tRNA ligase, partial [Intrasporangium sp.]|nr:arginine--tRNA ligase [Intrasporangium sp.]
MVSPLVALTPKVQSAIAAVLGDDYREVDPVLRPSQFADVQVNAALALAKKVGMPPRDLATKIVEALDLEGVCDSVEVSGPGFINLTYSNGWIASLLAEVDADARLGVPVQERENIPIDYSAPNVAKEMHVGHLRTTIVGDSLARTLEHLGHNVIRQNHIGDWGTPFGMLIEHLLEVGEDSEEARLLVTDPNAFYQSARVKFDTAEKAEPAGSGGDFDVRARARVVKLQGGDEATLAHWQRLVDMSKAYFNKVYSTLGVTLTDDDLAGESMYNDELAKVCDELEAKGIATISDGALCVFLDGYTGREGKPVPLIIRKSDGGYGYATTDLATIKYRVRELHAHRVLYVIGAPQALHLNMVWDTARKAGWLPEDVTPVHIQIGNVLGEDRKILKTRSGKPLRLMMLLDEAVEKAQGVIDAARPDLDAQTRATIARQIGIGAVKYADLSVAHDSEYVFDLERMVSLTGNTGPYLQYVGARVRSIFRQVGLEPAVQHAPVVLTESHERDLAKRLLDFPDVVVAVGSEYEPHRLCGYLFELAQSFSAFYENCPVLKAESDEVKESRLTLSALVLRTMVT